MNDETFLSFKLILLESFDSFVNIDFKINFLIHVFYYFIFNSSAYFCSLSKLLFPNLKQVCLFISFIENLYLCVCVGGGGGGL